MPVVELRGAVALLGRFPALAGVDLAIESGETVLLQGPNGAGKTTLLRLLGGLQRLESGSGTVFDHDLADERPAIRRRVGYLGHHTGLYDDLTVEENVTFWARASRIGTDKSARRDTVAGALSRVGVDDRVRGLRVSRLSAGQRRRAALASIVVRRPELWLLDEPHAGLDQAGRSIVDRLIVDAVEAGATVVVSSHELERVKPLGPRVVTIGGGAVYADDGGGGERATRTEGERS